MGSMQGERQRDDGGYQENERSEEQQCADAEGAVIEGAGFVFQRGDGGLPNLHGFAAGVDEREVGHKGRMLESLPVDDVADVTAGLAEGLLGVLARAREVPLGGGGGELRLVAAGARVGQRLGAAGPLVAGLV